LYSSSFGDKNKQLYEVSDLITLHTGKFNCMYRQNTDKLWGILLVLRSFCVCVCANVRACVRACVCV